MPDGLLVDWRRVLLVAGGLLLALLVTMSAAPIDAPVTSDDGAYAIEVEAVRSGTWSTGYLLADVDPGATAYPLVNADLSESGYYPAVRRPAWVLALTGFRDTSGVLGMRMLPVAGAVGAALATGWLAMVVGSSASAPWAVVAVAASPLAFNGLQLWAHAVAALLFALTIGSALRATRPGPRAVAGGWAVLACAALVAGVSARSELVLFGLSLAAVLGVTGLLARTIRTAATAGALGVVAIVAHLANGRWSAAITGEAGTASATQSRAGSWAGRLSGFVSTFVSDAKGEPAAFILALLAVLLVGVAVVRHRSGQPGTGPLLAGATAAWVVRIVVAPRALLTGLLVAWPVVVVLAVRPSRPRTPDERVLVGVVVLGSMAIAATQYDDGGGLNWGGRFVLPLVPVLAVLLAPCLHAVWSARGTGASGTQTDGIRAGWLRAGWLRAGLVGILVLPLVGSLVVDRTARIRHDRFLDIVERADPDVPVITGEEALPRLAWRTAGDIDWLLPPQDGGVLALRALLIEAGIAEVAVFRLGPVSTAALTGTPTPDGFDPTAVTRVVIEP